MAVDHNEFIAQTTNRQTVLNILRAREREPIHYTSFGPITGQMRASGSLGLNTTIGGDGGSLTQTDTDTLNSGASGAPTGTVATNTVADALTRGATNWAPSVGIGVNTGTDFQVVANATQEYYRGILSPLSSNIVVHFLRQGYPADLVSHLVIAEIQFSATLTDPQGQPHTIPISSLPNAPDEPVASREFAAAVRCRYLTYRARPVPERTLPVAQLSELSGVEAAVISRLRVPPPLPGPELPASASSSSALPAFQVVTPARTEFDLALSEPATEACAEARASLDEVVVGWLRRNGQQERQRPPGSRFGGTEALIVSPGRSAPSGPRPENLTNEGGPSFGAAGFFDDVLPPGWSSKLVIDLTLRSVEGIIYYLGEYIRNEGTSPLLHDPRGCRGLPPYCIPIIRVRPASAVPASLRFVDVSYRGRTYAVPLSGAQIGPVAGRSSQAIALVQQLLNLHRSASDTPTTPLVRVLN